jgi:hypothetical protein
MNSTYAGKFYILVFFCPRNMVMVDTNEGIVDVVLEEIPLTMMPWQVVILVGKNTTTKVNRIIALL